MSDKEMLILTLVTKKLLNSPMGGQLVVSLTDNVPAVQKSALDYCCIWMVIHSSTMLSFNLFTNI